MISEVGYWFVKIQWKCFLRRAKSNQNCIFFSLNPWFKNPNAVTDWLQANFYQICWVWHNQGLLCLWGCDVLYLQQAVFQGRHNKVMGVPPVVDNVLQVNADFLTHVFEEALNHAKSREYEISDFWIQLLEIYFI